MQLDSLLAEGERLVKNFRSPMHRVCFEVPETAKVLRSVPMVEASVPLLACACKKHFAAIGLFPLLYSFCASIRSLY